MKPLRLLAICFIIAGTSIGWWLLSAVVNWRTHQTEKHLSSAVASVWGPEMQQAHPVAYLISPPPAPASGEWQSTEPQPERTAIQPVAAKIDVRLDYDPRRRGLLWHRTYGTNFTADYTFTSPDGPRTLEVAMELPSQQVTLRDFSFDLGGAGQAGAKLEGGRITARRDLAAGESVTLKVSYACRGTDTWRYLLPFGTRLKDFRLVMSTNFADISFPVGTASTPMVTEGTDGRHLLEWIMPDAVAAQHIGMDMPATLNAGPVVADVAAWAPLSLVLFFGVLLLISVMRGIDLHPMHYLFCAAGLFAFPLLFAYSVDLLPVHAAFFIAAGVSLTLVCGYLRAVGGGALFRTAVAAHLSYVVLFSYSFFHPGASGFVLTILGIVTLGVLMHLTARVDWSARFRLISPKLA